MHRYNHPMSQLTLDQSSLSQQVPFDYSLLSSVWAGEVDIIFHECNYYTDSQRLKKTQW